MNARVKAALSAILLVGLMVAGCFGESPDLGAVADTESSLLRSGPLPYVQSIQISPATEARWYATVRFSVPMDPETLLGRIALYEQRGPDGAQFGLGAKAKLDERFGYQWDSQNRTLTVAFTPFDADTYRVVLDAGIADQSGFFMDGTVNHRQDDERDLVRSSDDGFAYASTHISLPYYAVASQELGSHARYRLHDDRPAVEMVLWDALGNTYSLSATDTGIEVEAAITEAVLYLKSSNHRGLGFETPERIERAYFAPGAGSAIQITDATGAAVESEFVLDQAQILEDGLQAVTAVESQFVGLSGAGGEEPLPYGHLALTSRVPVDRLVMDQIEPVTGGVLFDPYLVQSTGLVIPNTNILYDTSAAWLANELQFQSVSSALFNLTAQRNGGGSIVLSGNVTSCAPECDYTVRNDPALRVQLGSDYYLVADALGADLASVDQPMPWTVVIKGPPDGVVDVYGIGMYDQVRDGDEIGLRIDNDVRWVIQEAP